MDTLAGVSLFTARLRFLSLPEHAGSAISRCWWVEVGVVVLWQDL